MPTDTSKGGQRNKPNARARAAALREQQRKQEARRKMLTIGGITVVVLAVIAVMVILFVTKSDKKNSALRHPASPAIVKQLTTIPAATYQAVGAGNTTGGPTKVSGTPLTQAASRSSSSTAPSTARSARRSGGRWSPPWRASAPVTNLQQTTSSSQDSPASIPTFSFYGAKFTSPYFDFQSVETYTNQAVGQLLRAPGEPHRRSAAPW